jgi:hypothetical protein
MRFWMGAFWAKYPSKRRILDVVLPGRQTLAGLYVRFTISICSSTGCAIQASGN